MWNGTAETLKQKPTASSPTASSASVACSDRRRDRRADDVEPRRAGDREGERDAVEEERAREGAEQEVLERRLGARRARAAQPGQDVDRQRQHLERQEDHQQVGGGRHQHHAADREQRQRVVLAGRQPLALHDVVREHHRQDADDAEDDVDEEGEVVGADDAEADRVGVPEEARRDQRRRRGRSGRSRRCTSARPAAGSPRPASRRWPRARRSGSGWWRRRRFIGHLRLVARLRVDAGSSRDGSAPARPACRSRPDWLAAPSRR